MRVWIKLAESRYSKYLQSLLYSVLREMIDIQQIIEENSVQNMNLSKNSTSPRDRTNHTRLQVIEV